MPSRSLPAVKALEFHFRILGDCPSNRYNNIATLGKTANFADFLQYYVTFWHRFRYSNNSAPPQSTTPEPINNFKLVCANQRPQLGGTSRVQLSQAGDRQINLQMGLL